MKKNLLSITLICIASAVMAQSAMVAQFQKSCISSKSPGQNSIQSIDTLWQYFDRSTSFKIYGVQSGGYIFGTGFYNGGMISDETAAHYDGIGNATITEVLMWCGYKNIAGGGADNLTVNIYSVNADSSANALLGSGTLTTADLDTSGNFTAVTVNAPVTAAFLASIAYAGIDDTFGLVCNDPTMGDGAGEKRARYLLNPTLGGTWAAISDLFTGGLDADVMIIPVADVTSGMQQFEAKDFSLKPVYPSPAKDFITLDYSLHVTATCSFNIIDKTGRTVLADNLTGAQGRSVRTINTSELAAGTYYITFRAGTGAITQKFTVIK